MNELEKHIYKRKVTLLEACREFGIELDEATINHLETCSSCSIWYKSTELQEDLDGNPICKLCRRFYGL